MKIGDVRIYEVTESALQEYRQNVKGNGNTSHGEATLKLSRNIKLAKDKDRKHLTVIHKYGNLHIYTVFDKIVKIVNHKDNSVQFHLDKKEYYRIGKLLGIR